MKNRIIVSLLALTMLGGANEFYYENGKKVELTELNISRSVGSRVLNSRTKYYKTASGKKIGVRDDILVECKADKDCKEVLSQYDTISISQLTSSIYIIKIASDKNIFEFAQKLYNNDSVKLAHPNIRKAKRSR